VQHLIFLLSTVDEMNRPPP